MLSRSSRRRKRKPALGLSWRFFGLLLLVAGLAVICGWVINTLLVQGYLWAPVEQTELPGQGEQPAAGGTIETPPAGSDGEINDDSPVEIRQDSRRFYLTQLGAMSTKGAADRLTIDLAAQGQAAAYHFDGDLYRVFGSISIDKATAEAIVAMNKASDRDAFVKEIFLPALNKELVGAEAHYFQEVAVVVDSLEDAFISLLEDANLDAVRLDGLQKQLKEAKNSLWQKEAGAELSPLHEQLLAAADRLGDTLAAAAKFMSTSDDQARLQGENGLIEFLFLYQALRENLQNLPY